MPESTPPARTFRPRATDRARELRRDAPPAERLLWRRLSASQLGAKFSRQMPLGRYFADFLCRELGLVIELDGFSHETRQGYDAARDRWLAEAGYRVLRITNAEVGENLEGCAWRLPRRCGSCASRAARAADWKRRNAHPQPLPPAGGE